MYNVYKTTVSCLCYWLHKTSNQQQTWRNIQTELHYPQQLVFHLEHILTFKPNNLISIPPDMRKQRYLLYTLKWLLQMAFRVGFQTLSIHTKTKAPFRAVRQPPIDTCGPAACFRVASGKLSLGFFLTESYSLGGGTFHLQISLSNGSYVHDLWPPAFFMHPRTPATQMSHGNLMKVACFVTPRKGQREPYGEEMALQSVIKYVC